MADRGVRWLDADEQHSWRAYIVGTTLLLDQLDRELRQSFRISLAEYEIMVRLSEREDHGMRMAQLADSVCHSRSRVTHTVQRMENAGLVRRQTDPEDGRGVAAVLTEEGMAVLEEAARTHVGGVRTHLVDLASPEDFAALGRVMDAVTDALISQHPEAEIR